MKCPGLRCDGCGDRGSGALVAVLVVLAVIGAAIYHVRRGIETAIEITGLTLLSMAGLALITGGVYAAVRIRAHVLEARTRRTIPARAQVIRLREPPIVTGPATGHAIEAPRQRTDGWPLAGDWQEINPSTDRRTSS
jgi:hypothetical protein